MAKVLFITETDLKRHTIVDGNVDNNKLLQYVEIAQDTHIQQYLGTKLTDKLLSEIENSTIEDVGKEDYLKLLKNHVKPMLIHWAMVEYLPFAAYTLANKGMYKHQSENSESVNKSEVDFLVEKQRSIAQHYTRRFIEYMCANRSKYPEYNDNTTGDVYPSSESNYGGWVL